MRRSEGRRPDVDNPKNAPAGKCEGPIAPGDPVDKAVGVALRQLRRARRASQQEIADRLGVTVQQIQKYERGENRMTAAAIWRAADLLDVGVEAFYAGLKGRPSPFAPPKREDRVIVVPLPRGVSARYVRESELVGVMIDYQEIANPSLRASIRQLVRRIAEDAEKSARGR
jgi:transcriptional regulator with XRE-family HTH domain